MALFIENFKIINFKVWVSSNVKIKSVILLGQMLDKNRNHLSRSKCIGKPGSHQLKSGSAGWVGSNLGEFNKGYPLSNNFLTH